jgi:hypothetical protein
MTEAFCLLSWNSELLQLKLKLELQLKLDLEGEL